MPRVAYFYGISIYMYPHDHPRPHLHAEYAEFEVKIEFSPFRVERGYAPARVLAAVEEWVAEHHDELMANWELCAAGKNPLPIDPLK